MGKPTQKNRPIAIESSLGEDVLLLRSFTAREELSRLFQIELDLYSEDDAINFDDIVGQNVTIRLDLPEGGTRYWNGYISQFTQGISSSPQFAQYRASMVPWAWFLTLTADCRIFQNMTVPDIVKQVFNDFRFSDIEDRLSGGYRTWEYCVQYQETAFNFVSRLMEQEGIYYYFMHEQGKCTIVLCDSLSKHDNFEYYDKIAFTADTKASSIQERITQWTLEKKVSTGKFAHTDYNPLKPKTSLMSTHDDQKSTAQAGYEIYEYPGEYPEKSDGDRYAQLRMEALAYSHDVCRGQSDARGIRPGYRFSLEKHGRKDQNREVLVLSTTYQASAADYETGGALEDMCNCTFRVIPISVQFRPDRITRKPSVTGTQTAVVTGPSGEEIYTDEFGRVKVQFHWDREGQYDENSSCWIRVSQVHAGKGFGGIDIPRIGEEVVVSFMEGDPDQPLITGRVYNAEQTVPFGLPGQKVVSGMKSNSTPGGGGYNQITLDDTKGQEGMTVHAQYNMDTTVENDQSNTINNNRTTNVAVDDTETIGANQNISVGADQSISIGSNQNVSIGSNRTLNIGSADTVAVGAALKQSVGGNHALSVGGSQNVSVSGAINITSDTSITLTVGGSTVKIEPASVSIKSTKITSEGSAKVETKGALVVSEAAGVNEIKGATIKLN